jgi:hypothetical protein
LALLTLDKDVCGVDSSAIERRVSPNPGAH